MKVRKSQPDVAAALEPLEPRWLLGADLSVLVGLGMSDTWLPGDKIQVPAIITNHGPDRASGDVFMELWLSKDGVAGDDQRIDGQTNSVNLAVGQSKAFTLKFTVPSDAEPRDYYPLVWIFPEAGVGDANPSNDGDVGDQACALVWRFGSLVGRKNCKLKLSGMGGVPVTFSLSGGGYGEVVGGEAFAEVILRETTARSKLSIKTSGKMETSVGDITIDGPLGQLTAKTTNLRGGLWADGGVGKLVLGDVDAAHEIVLNAGGGPVDPKLTCSIVLGEVYDCLLETHGVPIKSLTVTRWLGGGTIRAPWLGKLAVKGDARRGLAGNFWADLELDGAGGPKLVLGSAKIAGDLDHADWDLAGDVGKVRIGVGAYWSAIDVAGGVGSFQAGDFADCSLAAGGAVRKFSVEYWDGSDLSAHSLGKLAAGTFREGRLQLSGAGVPAGKPALGSAKLGEIFDSDSATGRGWEIHGHVGKVAAGDADVWSLAVHGDIKSIKMGAAWDTELLADGAVGSIKVKEWFGGVLQADAIGSVKVTGDRREDLRGDFDAADLIVVGANVEPGKLALGSLSIAGLADDLVIQVMGNVGKVTAGAMAYSQLMIGCTAITGDASDFDDGAGQTREYLLKSLTLKGIADTPDDPPTYFSQSSLAAWEIGQVKFKSVPDQASGEIQYHLGRLVNGPELGPPGDLYLYQV